jgi:tetratricopeptide (TPR) repeat protein
MDWTKPTIGRITAGRLCALVALATVGCATTHGDKPSPAPMAVETTPIGQRAVQTIRLEPPAVDGQTSWIIEPDVPRIPKIKGLDRQLPPHIEQRLSRAFDLAQRGATYSANSEFHEVLSLCALELDAREGTTSHRDALRQGLVALDEADEISGQRIDWSNAAEVRLATAGHLTPVLHGNVPPGADSIQVVQLYYSFAEERFAYACQGLPGASVAYYGLARTYVQPGARYEHAAGKSAMLQRVALRVAPQNVLAGNELGVLLAQHGHLDEAESLFKQCVATDASPEAWQNLATVHARKGNLDASRAAMTECGKLAASRTASKLASMNLNSEGAVETATVASLAQTKSTDETRAPADTHLPDKGHGGLWSKLDLSQKLPSLFRR